MTQTPGSPEQQPQPVTATPVPPAGGEVETNKDARTMGMLAHLLGIFTSFVGPLIIWLIKKDEFPFVDDQGKEALNWQITLMIAYMIGGVTTLICIGAVILPLVGVCAIIFGIIGSMKANQGIRYRYPFAIRLVK